MQVTTVSKLLIKQEHSYTSLANQDGGNQDGQFKTPRGLLVDSSNNLLVCDIGNKRVQQFSLDGRFIGNSTTWLTSPTTMTKAPDGRIFVISCEEKKVYILK